MRRFKREGKTHHFLQLYSELSTEYQGFEKGPILVFQLGSGEEGQDRWQEKDKRDFHG